MELSREIESRVAELAKICERRRWSVGLAESCTAGLLSSWIGSQPGVSHFFSGSVVSYSAEVKTDVLHVPMHLIQAHGEVSLPVAKAMAQGARDVLSSSWAVSLTGVAGPSGGSVDKPVGTVCFGLAGPGLETCVRKQFQPTLSRQDIQRQAALFAFDFLLSAMRWPLG